MILIEKSKLFYTEVFFIATLYTSYITGCFLLYVIAAVLFYRFSRKAIEAESERQVREQNLLFAAVAHDLKTPMTSVKGFAKAIADGRIPEIEQKEICEIIYRKSDHMNELVNTLFEYAKLGTKEYTLQKEPLDLCALLREILADAYCDFEDHSIVLTLDIPKSPVFLQADQKELRRALSNLIINTYRHNPDGIRVFVSLTDAASAARLIIADTGNALPTDRDIFEPFVTENESRTSGNGTGLGLAITKRILQKHDAKISVNRNPAGYTKAFEIEFPI